MIVTPVSGEYVEKVVPRSRAQMGKMGVSNSRRNRNNRFTIDSYQ